MHSRVHEVPWLRSVRPYPTCDLYEDDAVRLGIETGDDVVLESPHGKIFVKARVTGKTKPGVILMLHGYTEANVNNLVGRNHLDPYTGYPGFKGMRCNVYKYRGDEK